MRLLWLLTLWAEGNTGGFQSIMGAAHIALGFRGLFLWYCHCLCVSLRVPARPAFICISGSHPVLLTNLNLKILQGRKAWMKYRRFTVTASLIQVTTTGVAKSKA